MGRTGIGRCSSPRARAVTLAVGRVAKEGTPFDHALKGIRIARIITLRWTGGVATDVLACGLNLGVDPVPIAAPLPDVAGHVVQAVAICRKGANRGSTCKSIFAGVADRERSLPRICHVPPAGPKVITPDVA